MLSQGDHPLVTFDPWGGLEQRAGGGLALGQRPEVREMHGIPDELRGACGPREPVGAGAGKACAGASASGHLGLPVCVAG